MNFEKTFSSVVNNSLLNGSSPLLQSYSQEELQKLKVFNPTNNIPYNNDVQLLLMTLSKENYNGEPRWLTADEAKLQGGTLKQGEQATTIKHSFNMNGTEHIFNVNVYNVSQFSFPQEHKLSQPITQDQYPNFIKEPESLNQANEIIKNVGIKINSDNESYVNFQNNSIHVNQEDLNTPKFYSDYFKNLSTFVNSTQYEEEEVQGTLDLDRIQATHSLNDHISSFMNCLEHGLGFNSKLELDNNQLNSLSEQNEMFVQEAIKYAETTNQTINKIVQNNIDEKRVFLDYEFTLENLNKLTELNAKFDPNAHRFYIDPSFDKSLFNEFLPESERVVIEEQKQEETIEPQTQEVEQSQEKVLETSNEQVNSIEPKEEANEIEAEQNISIETNNQDIEQEQEQSIEATQEATIEQSDEIESAINNEQEIEQTNTPSRAVQSEDLDRTEIQENSNEVSKQVDTTAEQIAKVDNSDIEADISTSFKPYKDYEVYGICADFEDVELPENVEQELFNCENNERTKFFNYFSRAYRMGFFHDVSVKDVKDVITKLNVDYEREHEFIEWQTRFDPNYINNAKDFTDEEKNYTNNQVLQTHTALIDTIVKNPKLKEETLKNGMPPMSFIQIDNSRDRSNCYNQRSNDPFENPNALCDKEKYGIDKFTNRFIPLADANDYLNLLDEKYKKEYKHINFKKYDIYQNKKYNGNPINNDFSVIYKEENVGFNKFIIDERTAQNRLEYEIYDSLQ